MVTVDTANAKREPIVPLVARQLRTLGVIRTRHRPVAGTRDPWTHDANGSVQKAATMATNGKYSLLTQEITTSPPDRGRLWYDDEIPDQFFRGRVSVRWVRTHLPRGKGIKIGRDWA
jgi:hypothetical protein